MKFKIKDRIKRKDGKDAIWTIINVIPHQVYVDGLYEVERREEGINQVLQGDVHFDEEDDYVLAERKFKVGDMVKNLDKPDANICDILEIRDKKYIVSSPLPCEVCIMFSCEHLYTFVGHNPNLKHEPSGEDIVKESDDPNWNPEFDTTLQEDSADRDKSFIEQVNLDDFKRLAEAEDEGVKYDGEKPEYGLVPPHALEEVAQILTFGAKKYSRDNWKKVPHLRERYFDAAQRHMWALKRDEKIDPESGKHHMAHAICCLMFYLEADLTEIK